MIRQLGVKARNRSRPGCDTTAFATVPGAPTAASLLPHGLTVRRVPVHSLSQAIFKRDAWRPPQRAQATHVEQLARCSVLLGGVPLDGTGEANGAGNELGDFLDRPVHTGADVDRLRRVVVLKEKDDCGREVVDVQELAKG